MRQVAMGPVLRETGREVRETQAEPTPLSVQRGMGKLNTSTRSPGQRSVSAAPDGQPAWRGCDHFLGISASMDMPPYVYVRDDLPTAVPDRVVSANAGKGFWCEGPLAPEFRQVKQANDTERDAEKRESLMQQPCRDIFPTSARALRRPRRSRRRRCRALLAVFLPRFLKGSHQHPVSVWNGNLRFRQHDWRILRFAGLCCWHRRACRVDTSQSAEALTCGTSVSCEPDDRERSRELSISGRQLLNLIDVAVCVCLNEVLEEADADITKVTVGLCVLNGTADHAPRHIGLPVDPFTEFVDRPERAVRRQPCVNQLIEGETLDSSRLVPEAGPSRGLSRPVWRVVCHGMELKP